MAAAAAAKRAVKRRAAPAGGDDAAETAVMKDIMMTRKAKKMYQGLQKTRAAKKARVEELEKKAAALAAK